MNAKTALQSLLLLSFALTGAACSATTSTLSASHPVYDARNERVADFDHASGRPSSAMDLRMAVVRH